MTNTSVIVRFPDVEFTGEDIKEARVTEEFHPLSVTLPVNTLDLTLYSDDLAFSIINPSGRFESLVNRQPMAVYVVVGGVETYIGQFFLDDWQSKSESLKRFKCVDVLGILDKYDYLGGLWVSPITVGELVADILGMAEVEYEIDPDVAAIELTGWLPICSYREALQQVLFAAGAYIIVPRKEVPIIGRITQVTTETSMPHLGTAQYHAGVSRNRQFWFRPAQSYVYTTGNAVTRGRRSGVFRTGVSRVREHWFRRGQWEGILPTYDIPDSWQAGRKLNLRPLVTGVEVVAHDLTESTNYLELFNSDLAAGLHEIRFPQPMHDLSLTGPIMAIITESGANYAIVSVTTPGTVVLTGQTYLDTQRVFSQYVPETNNAKENIMRVTNATMVTASNGEDVLERLYNYYQQRYVQSIKFFAGALEVGATVNMQTLYNNNLYGIVERSSTNLSQGNVAQLDAIGIITGQYQG